MKEVLIAIFMVLFLATAAWAPTPELIVEEPSSWDEIIWRPVSDTVVQLSLIEKIMNHPDAVEMSPGWYRIVIKENLSDTAYDWRFDLRKIETKGGTVVIGHRQEQNSGQHPDSNWVIETLYVDKLGDGDLDAFLRDRYISVKDGEGWYKILPRWPDEFNYPQDRIDKETQRKLFKDELEYWQNKLQ